MEPQQPRPSEPGHASGWRALRDALTRLLLAIVFRDGPFWQWVWVGLGVGLGILLVRAGWGSQPLDEQPLTVITGWQHLWQGIWLAVAVGIAVFVLLLPIYWWALLTEQQSDLDDEDEWRRL